MATETTTTEQITNSREFRAAARAALRAKYGEAFDAEVFERAMRKTDRFAAHKYGKGLWSCYDANGAVIPGAKKDRWGCEFEECEFGNVRAHYAECLAKPTGTHTFGHALAQERR